MKWMLTLCLLLLAPMSWAEESKSANTKAAMLAQV